MSFEVERVYKAGFTCWKIGSRGVIRVLSRVFCRFRSITTEVSAAFGAYDGRESLRFDIRKRVNNDIFDPVGMATRTAAVFVPFAGIGIELQELVHDWVGHIAAPQLFRQTIRILYHIAITWGQSTDSSGCTGKRIWLDGSTIAWNTTNYTAINASYVGLGAIYEGGASNMYWDELHVYDSPEVYWYSEYSAWKVWSYIENDEIVLEE